MVVECNHHFSFYNVILQQLNIELNIVSVKPQNQYLLIGMTFVILQNQKMLRRRAFVKCRNKKYGI